MRQHIVIIACLCSALVYALPVADNQDGLQIVQIPLSDNKELDIVSVDSDGRLSERSKRTIGILRDLFPELTKQVEDQVNSIVAQIIRSLGPTILRTAIQGTPNRARANFDADFDDDDDDDSNSSSRVQIDLPSFNPDDDKDDDSNKTDSDNLNAGDNSIDLTALNEQLQETIRVARQAAANDNLITSGDQTAAESKSPAIDELTLEDDTADGDDRNKRFLPFGFGGSASASSGSASGGGAGGGAGSGNFLFDIIRNSAGRAARAVGTAYRFVAGGDDNEVDGDTIRLRRQMSSLPRQMSRFVERTARTLSKGLFSGSVQTQQGDERANEPASSSEDTSNAGASAGASADGYTEGIPGPVTRLVVLANRGLANLIQDLILRIAATSERLVNFKARLITSLI